MIKRFVAILFLLSLILSSGCYFCIEKKSGGASLQVFDGETDKPLEGVLVEVGMVSGFVIEQARLGGKPLHKRWRPSGVVFTTNSTGSAFHPPDHEWKFRFFLNWGDPIPRRLYRFSKPGYKPQWFDGEEFADYEIVARLAKEAGPEKSTVKGIEKTMAWSTFVYLSSGTVMFFTIPILFATSPVWFPIAYWMGLD